MENTLCRKNVSIYPTNTSRFEVETVFKYGLGFLLLHGCLRNLFSCVLLLAGINATSTVSAFFKVLSVIFIIPTFVVVVFRKPVSVVGSLVAFALVWYLSYSYNQQSQMFIADGIVQFFVECLPYCWFFFFLFDKKEYRKIKTNEFLFRVSKIELIVLIVIQTIIFVFPKADVYHDYMSAAYILLNPLLVVSCRLLLEKKKRCNLFLVLLSTFYLLMLGSRGALLCEFLFFVSFFILFKVKRVSNKVFLIAFLLVMVLIIPFVAKAMIYLFGGNRVLVSLSSFTFFSDSSRMTIFNFILNKTFQNPFGLGVLADRYLLLNSNIVWETYYSHNIVLELGIDFGLFGFVLFGVLVLLIFKAFKNAYGFSTKIIILAFFSFSIIKLMFSSSIWIDSSFWKFIGVITALAFSLRTKRIVHA